MVKTGLEKFLENADPYKKRRLALIANQTSLTRDFQYSWDVLKRRGFHLKRIFTPEHGLFATEQDQIAVVRQPDLNCDVVSLYGKSFASLTPQENFLDDLDTVLFDVQDVGCRYYTFVNTLALFMKALEKKDIEIIVLDRPNPLGGIEIEGPLLNKKFLSFVGMVPVPVRHGMTVGELALFYRDAEKLDIHLTLVKMDGWKRRMLYRETGLLLIFLSHNTPTENTAYVYPGFCLLEGLNVSEGRGTATPFQWTGAPFIEPYELKRCLESVKMQGVVFRPVYFKPAFHKYAGQVVGGVGVHILDMKKFKPFSVGVTLVKTIHDLYHEHLVFRKDVYEFNSTRPAFDLLTGSSRIRKMIQAISSLEDVLNSWKDEERSFVETKEEYSLYAH